MPLNTKARGGSARHQRGKQQTHYWFKERTQGETLTLHKLFEIQNSNHFSMVKTMAGYSDTPLIKKLGIKEGFLIALIGAPQGFRKELGTLPDKVKITPSVMKSLDLIMLFVHSKLDLEQSFSALAANLSANGICSGLRGPKRVQGLLPISRLRLFNAWDW